MNPTNIDWCDFTWNPVTGCKRGCSYCYARRIYERFNKGPFSEMKFHENRLQEPLKAKKPSTIFVGSMSDIEYWEPKWTEAILEICKAAPWHTFMFLSKNPISYHGYEWPSNTMQGLTMICTQTEHCQREMQEQMTKYPRPFLSVEPILGILRCRDFTRFERVIVGAMTGNGAIKPRPEWIESIKANVPSDKLWWKTNIKQYL